MYKGLSQIDSYKDENCTKGIFLTFKINEDTTLVDALWSEHP
jgi:hypothetical protein